MEKRGSTFKWVVQAVRKLSRIEELERPNRIVWSGRMHGIRAYHMWEFEEKEGGTLVCTGESFEGLRVKILRGVIRRILSRVLKKVLWRLRTKLKRRTS